MSFRFEVERVNPPADFPVTLAEAKAACRVLHVDEDDFITGLIAAATDYFDGPFGYLGQCILPQTWRVSFPVAPPNACALQLPFGPAQSLVSVKSWDGAIESNNLAANFRLFNKRMEPIVAPMSGQAWPILANEPDALRIEFIAGDDDAPPRLKQAILMLVAHWFVNREGVLVGSVSKQIEFGIEALVVNLRRFW